MRSVLVKPIHIDSECDCDRLMIAGDSSVAQELDFVDPHVNGV